MPTGSIALALEGVENMIAASAAFQARVGAASAAEAKGAILREGQVEQNAEPGATLAPQRPFCVLAIDAHGYLQIGQGSLITLGNSGGILAIFTDNPVTPEDHKASHDEFIDWVSTVLDEAAENSGRDGYWPVKGIDLVESPWRPNLVDRVGDDFWICAYVLRNNVNEGG